MNYYKKENELLKSEIESLRAEIREYEQKYRNALQILYDLNNFSLDSEFPVDRQSTTARRHKQALEALGLIDKNSNIPAYHHVSTLHEYLEITSQANTSKEQAISKIATSRKTSKKAIVEILKKAVSAETASNSGVKPDFLQGILPADWPK